MPKITQQTYLPGCDGLLVWAPLVVQSQEDPAKRGGLQKVGHVSIAYCTEECISLARFRSVGSPHALRALRRPPFLASSFFQIYIDWSQADGFHCWNGIHHLRWASAIRAAIDSMISSTSIRFPSVLSVLFSRVCSPYVCSCFPRWVNQVYILWNNLKNIWPHVIYSSESRRILFIGSCKHVMRFGWSRMKLLVICVSLSGFKFLRC